MDPGKLKSNEDWQKPDQRTPKKISRRFVKFEKIEISKFLIRLQNFLICVMQVIEVTAGRSKVATFSQNWPVKARQILQYYSSLSYNTQ